MNESFILVQPLTYMNNSGSVISDVLERYASPGDQLVVIVDNLDLPEGMCRIKKKGSDGGHNGLKSISENLGHNDYLRIFVGIDRPAEKEEIQSYVLSPPDVQHGTLFMHGVEKAAEAALKLLYRPLNEVMSEYNQRART